MNTRRIIRIVCSTAACLAIALTLASSQTVDLTEAPPGFTLNSCPAIQIPYAGELVVTPTKVLFRPVSLFGGSVYVELFSFPQSNGSLPSGQADKIVKVHYDKVTKSIWITTEKGKVFRATIDPTSVQEMTSHCPALTSGETCLDFKGDALYLLTSKRFFISRDSALTWQIDTAGLGKAPTCFDLDTMQFVFAATSAGMYRQHPDSMTWTKLTAYTGTAPSAIFVDRRNRVRAGNSSSKVYVSTNQGTSWSLDTAGIGLTPLTRFCDDAFNNVYGITNDRTKLYRSLGGTQPWTRIDQPVTSQIKDPNVYIATSNPLLLHVAGDTVLKLGTAFGLFVSTDQGTSWAEEKGSLSSEVLYGYLRTSAGRTIAHSPLGIYYKNAGVSTWTKTFPSSGYFAYPNSNHEILYADGAGNIYSLGPRINQASSLFPPAPIRSTDGGLTWVPDTAGFGAVGQAYVFNYYVDERGTQYLGSFNAASVPVLASKRSGQPWTADTIGYFRGSSNRIVLFYYSDKAGTMYVGTTGSKSSLLLTRSVNGGEWTPDTAGLGSSLVYAVVRDRSGNLIAGGLDGATYNSMLWKKVGGVWQALPGAAGLPGCGPYILSVDSSGRIYGVFGDLYNWRGVCRSTDGGNSWTQLGVDYVSIRALVSFGDTTFVLTQSNGVYKAGPQTGTEVAGSGNIPQAYQLFDNYPNPFNPSTTIRFTLPERSHVRLTVYNVLGQCVAELIDGEMERGDQSRVWSGHAASGIYLVRLEAVALHNPAERITEVKKMLLLK